MSTEADLEIEFSELDPWIRSLALHGLFLQSWALLESQINLAIAEAIELSPMQAVIVTKNLSFSAKINILRTTLSIMMIDERLREHYSNTLGQISNYSAIRNMFAHAMFSTSLDQTGVTFQVIKASSRFDFNLETWDARRVVRESKKMTEWENAVEQMKRAIAAARIDIRELVDANNELPSDALGGT